FLGDRADQHAHRHHGRRHADGDGRAVGSLQEERASIVLEAAIELKQVVLDVLGGARHGPASLPGSRTRGRLQHSQFFRAKNWKMRGTVPIQVPWRSTRVTSWPAIA